MLMNSSSTRLHLAIDLGTSTLTGRLLSSTGEVLSEKPCANPQRELAADILQRLQLAHNGQAERLHSLLIEGLRDLIAGLLDMADCTSDDIDSVAAAGNSGMSCLLRKLPVSSLLFPPHKPPYRKLVQIPAGTIDLGLAVPLNLFPLISGFVGGDLAACLFALKEVLPGTVLIDIGTNAELALWDGCRWWVTSAAAGPAFEGGNIETGMLLSDGAVTDVRLEQDRLLLSVAGGGAPRGLCGSGLVALVAAARQGDLVDATGRIRSFDEVETNLGQYLVERKGSWAIRFHRSASGDLFLTQEDLRNFQLAKGAVQAGTLLLLERGGFSAGDAPEVLLTGALGTALPKEVLKRVALLPEAMLDKTRFLKNGVLAGLQAFLMAEDGPQCLESLVATMQPVPLSGTPAFEKLFLATLEF